MKDVVIIGAGARGNRVFAELIATHETGFRVRGVVEPDERRRSAFRERYEIAPHRALASVDELVSTPRFADLAFICTPDPTHHDVCHAVAEHGYDILLEKPLATNLADCLALLDLQQSIDSRIYVAHVLRYSPFFRAIQGIIASGRLGEPRHLYLAEHIGHWHYAHSYVRGNWRRADTSAPILLTKSSHDLDLIYWLVGRPVRSIWSRGELSYFTAANAPEGAATRCVDCKLRDECIYSATRFYLNDRDEWPFNVPAPGATSSAERRRALENGPYGRCVWRSDNDVCDNQTVSLEFDNGLLATFGLHALTAENTRRVTILFDHAELNGDLRANHLEITHFTGQKEELHLERVSLPAMVDSHGGGDLELLRVLGEYLTTGQHEYLVSSLVASLPSHLLAFLAERSRQLGGVRIEVPSNLMPEPSA
jgi:hypothetical protein